DLGPARRPVVRDRSPVLQPRRRPARRNPAADGGDHAALAGRLGPGALPPGAAEARGGRRLSFAAEALRPPGGFPSMAGRPAPERARPHREGAMTRLRSTLAGALSAALAISLIATAPAEARRGGSFGSRGFRTYSAPRPTASTPGYVAPVQRSMTPRTPGGFQPAAGAYAPGYAYPQRRPGFGGGLVGGLVAGGLIGAMMGHGFGWGGGYGGWGGGFGMGLFATLIQLLVLGFVISFLVGLFRRRS